MKLFIPHPFKNQDNYLHFSLGPLCHLMPWYRKFKDEDIYEEHNLNVFHNYAGWLWFVINWYSAK